MDFISKSSLQKNNCKVFFKSPHHSKSFYQYLVKSDFRGNAKYLSTEFKCDFLGAFMVKFNRCSVGETVKKIQLLSNSTHCAHSKRGKGWWGKLCALLLKFQSWKKTAVYTLHSIYFPQVHQSLFHLFLKNTSNFLPRVQNSYWEKHHVGKC